MTWIVSVQKGFYPEIHGPFADFATAETEASYLEKGLEGRDDATIYVSEVREVRETHRRKVW